MAVQFSEQSGYGVSMVHRIVYALKKDIFKAQAACSSLAVFLAGWNKLLERIFFVDGHEFAS